MIDGGLADINGSTILWDDGTITIEGGTLTTDSLDHTHGGTLNFDDGNLNISGGTFDNGVAEFAYNGAGPGDVSTLRFSSGATGTVGALDVGRSGGVGAGELSIESSSAVTIRLALWGS